MSSIQVITSDDRKISVKLKGVSSYYANALRRICLNGIPVFVSEASLCYVVANSTYESLSKPKMPDRQTWANQLAYTEWFADEIEQGIPWQRIKKRLLEKYV